MKVVILAGGLGSRMSEETTVRPKPMVEIGHRPIIWHIMKIYSAHGLNDFIVCCGYQGWVIKEYFAKYFLNNSDVVFDLNNSKTEILRNNSEPWRVTCVDTGEQTMTGGRLKRVREYIAGETFCMTYGDGVANVDITALIKFHRQQKTLATLTAVQPGGRFGAFTLRKEENKLSSFVEKPQGDGAWVNGGFFVIEPSALDLVRDDSTVWEQEILKMLAHEGQLTAFRHAGFWHPMDTLRDKNHLEELWATGKAPWKVWERK
jgi:glucose-1-phosphate cytidylyltransferase